MPLPPAQKQQLVELNFQGLNVERGVLVRPDNSFAKLENFDLVKPGVIRKIRGNKRLTVTPIPNGIVGFRDYKQSTQLPDTLVVVDSMGKLYVCGMFDYPMELTLMGDLYEEEGKLDEAPYMVCLPFPQYNTTTKTYETAQYVVTTVGLKDYPKYFDGIHIYNLGIPNPGDQYTVPYQHSVAIPMVYYTNHPIPGTNAGDIMFKGTSPREQDGVYIGEKRSYRASWYNPITGHDSSLFPLSLEPYPSQDRFDDYLTSSTRPRGTVAPTHGANWVMAIPLFLDNLTNPPENPPTYPIIEEPQPGYTHIRFWATHDGNPEYYLVPVIYDAMGKRVSDIQGAVNFGVLGLRYGVQEQLGPIPQPLFDGYIPLYYMADDNFSLGQRNWAKMVPYNWDVKGSGEYSGFYRVTDDGQTGSALKVVLEPDEPTEEGGFVGNGRHVMSGYFKIEGQDQTEYRITGIVGIPDTVVGTATWVIEPPLTVTPAGGARITFMNIKPTSEEDLIIPWVRTTGANVDRQFDGPPKASWGVVYQNRLLLVDAEDKTRIAYSEIGRYEDFPPGNEFRFTQSDFDPVTALLAGRQVGLVSEGADARIVVGKQRTTAQITGTDATSFAIQALFPETGIVHKRAAIVIGGYLLGLSRQGLELYEGQRPVFIGSVIKDILDKVLLEEYGPCFTLDRKENQILLGFQFTPEADPPCETVQEIVLMREPRFNPDGSLASPFSTMTVPSPIGTMMESGLGDGIRLIAGAKDGHIYQFFTGKTYSDGTFLVATAETQLLPQNDRETRKIFHRIQFEGNIDDTSTKWKIQFSADDNGYWTHLRTMRSETLIGLVCKQLKVRIIHCDIEDSDEPPMLSNFMLEYTPIGEAR